MIKILWIEVPLTRRQRLSYITGPDDLLEFSAATVSACLHWLSESCQTEVVIETDEQRFHVTITEMPQSPEAELPLEVHRDPSTQVF